MSQRIGGSFAPRLLSRRACKPLAWLAVGAGSLFATAAWGLDVASQSDWNTAVAAVAAAGANSTVTINITGGFTLTSSLATLQASASNVTVVITGNGQTINGANAYQGLQVSGANGLAVQISSLSVANTKAVGGTGGAGQNGYYNSSLSYGSGGGGGGGLGAGGGLYIGSGASVTLSAVTFTGDNATGGAGGVGGSAQNSASSGTGGNGGAGGMLNGGAASVGGGGAGGAGGNTGTQGTGGTVGSTAGDGGGGGGGSGTTSSTSYTINNAGGLSNGGSGAGGSGGDGVTNNGGSQGPGSDGGFGGGGGAARGGAIYVATGGTLTIDDTAISGSTATGGAGGSSGIGHGPSAFNGSAGSTGVAAGAGVYLDGVVANIGVASGSLTYGDTIGGTGLTSGSVTTALNKTGAGALVLGATNTFVGDIDISAGTLSVGAAANLGNASNRVVISDGGTFAVTGTATFASGHAFKISGASSLDIAASTTSTIQGLVSDGLGGAGALSKIGAGALVLSGANTYTGGTTLSGGVVQVGVATVGSPGGITSSAIGVGTLTFDGGTLRAGGNYTIANVGAVNDTGGAIDANGHTFTYSGAIGDGDGANGSLSLVDSVGGGAIILSGANSYGAATSVGDGVHSVTLKGGAANAFSANSSVTVNPNATLDIGGFAQTIGALAGSGAVTNSGASASTLTIGGSGGSATFSGLIADGVGAVTIAMTGAGTQTLAGANTFSGGATLSAGVLQVGVDSVGTPGAITSSALGVGGLTFNGGALQAGGAYRIDNAATIANSATATIDVNGYAFTYAGGIDGGGALTVANSGADGSLTLTAANGYTGATTINSGATLILSGAGSIAASSGVAVNGVFDISALGGGTSIASLSGAGAVALGANRLTLSNASDTFSGALSGSGGLTLAGGAETLTGNNTYTGGTTISAGSLQIGEGGTSGSILGNVALSSASGRLIFDRSDSVTFAGLISGAGGLQQIGAGTLILPNANSYGGGTLIERGTLAVGDNQALGSGAVQMTNGATLAFTRSGVNLPNAISLGSLAGTIDTGAYTATISGVISGADELTKTGSGTLILTANNTYTGPTNINGGLLQVDGSIADSSQINIADGAHLTGTGSVGLLQFAAGSTFTPGTAGSPGTSTTVAGQLSLAAGSTYQIYLNPTASTFAHVGGTATIGGAVAATFLGGNYISKSYTILSAGSVSGTFGSLTNTNLPTNFSDKLSYDASHAYLDLTLDYTPPSPGPSPAAPSYSPLTVNQTRVTNTLVNYFNTTGGIPTAFGALSPVGLAQADGEAATGAERSSIQLMNQFLPLMLDPFLDGRWGASAPAGGQALGYAPDNAVSLPADARAYTAIVSHTTTLAAVPQRWTAWGSAYGGANTSSGDATVGSTHVTAQTYGVAAGADYHLSPDAIVGFALGGGGANWGLQNGMGSGDGQAFQAGVYGITRSGPAYLAGSVGFANNWFTTHRNAVGDELSANFTGQSYGGRLEAGYRYAALPTVGLTPYGALQAQAFDTPSYNESYVTGGSFGLGYGANSASDVRTELGARFDSAQTISGLSLVLRARLAWAHDFVDSPSLNATFQTLPGTGFTVDGASIRPDSALATVGADLSLSRNLKLLLKFDGDFGAGSQTYAGSGTLRLSW